MMKNEKGFTIMELLIVIVIIGVLAAIAVPAYKGYTKKAKIAACQANIRTINTAAALYEADNGEITTTIGDLASYISGGTMPKCPVDDVDYALGADGLVDGTNHAHPLN